MKYSFIVNIWAFSCTAEGAFTVYHESTGCSFKTAGFCGDVLADYSFFKIWKHTIRAPLCAFIHDCSYITPSFLLCLRLSEELIHNRFIFITEFSCYKYKYILGNICPAVHMHVIITTHTRTLIEWPLMSFLHRAFISPLQHIQKGWMKQRDERMQDAY